MTVPAEPMLASTLYSTYLASLDGAESSEDRPRKRRRIGTGCRSINDALGGGLVYGDGGICTISSENGAGGREIAQHLVISHLLSHPHATATFIDTQGSLDILSLRQRVLARLHHRHYAEPTTLSAVDQATQLLDRVRLMRVFDFEGMLEGIAELRSSLEAHASTQNSPSATATPEAQPLPRSTVQDSQAADDDGDEMLLDLALDPAPPNVQHAREAAHTPATPKDSPVQPPTLLLVDTLTAPLVPLQKSNNALSHALLLGLVRSLHHLTLAHGLCTLLLNGVVTYRYSGSDGQLNHENKSSSSSSNAERGSMGAGDGGNAGLTPSVFSSVRARPSLGKAFSHVGDVGLLVSRVPRTARDAGAVYGGWGGGGDGGDGHGKTLGQGGLSGPGRKTPWVGVVEVLLDRCEGRTGRFGFFDIDGQGLLVDGA